ncbi:amino acid dehydrogenase [Porticoccaceae bacterium]|jgi:leucine dehydrogenase|nr:amino acid dehydrogenase [Porticoccaceae bacterium]MDB4076712.1 amino acid dehydrogenase [Porticoccaceae bacterium]MDB9951809.1 amino acid dehydrogenase [Porticoccaceae bacterium]MDB9998982.1 amino acid dehydrogenase [Porticoccaceae bacterium]MDC0003153.1 amino acid dehydrogenase [Porticoccaceae bacterium]
MSVYTHKEFDDHQQIAFFNDRQSGLRAIIAVHNTNLGPALGGCRMWPYSSEDEALNDVLRLSRGMTYKSAIANLKLGGGKAVIIGDPRTEKSDALLYAMGDFIEGLGGRYITAEDSGTSVKDILKMGERTRYVSGVNKASDHGGDPSPSTAYGVFVSLREAVIYKLGRSNLKGLKVAIQGLGNVGYRLAEYLHEAGALLYVTDIVQASVDRAVRELGATAVTGDEIFALDVDVFAPCALGAAINDKTIGQLKAGIIAGAANNQLATVDHGLQLHKKGILYTPDYVVNAGGIIDVYYQRKMLEPEYSAQNYASDLATKVEEIGDTLKEIFERSAAENIPTFMVADRVAEERFNKTDLVRQPIKSDAPAATQSYSKSV